MEKKQLNIFEKIVQSVISIEVYSTFIKEPIKNAIWYMFFLSLIFGTLNFIQPSMEFNRFLDYVQTYIDKEIKTLSFKNGELKIENDKPIIIENKDYNIIMDTQNKKSEADIKNYNNAILITKDKMIMKNELRTNVIEFNTLKDLDFNKSNLINFIPKLKTISMIIIISTGAFAYFLGKLLSAITLAFFGMFIRRANFSNMPFKKLYIIALYSLTLPIIINLFTNILYVKLSFFSEFFLYYGVSMIYIVAIVLNQKNSSYSE